MPFLLVKKKRGGEDTRSICYTQGFSLGSLHTLRAQLLDQFSREESATKETERKQMASRDYGLITEQGKRLKKKKTAPLI